MQNFIEYYLYSDSNATSVTINLTALFVQPSDTQLPNYGVDTSISAKEAKIQMNPGKAVLFWSVLMIYARFKVFSPLLSSTVTAKWDFNAFCTKSARCLSVITKAVSLIKSYGLLLAYTPPSHQLAVWLIQSGADI